MYVDESFENEADGPNRAYVLSFAADSPGQRLVVRFWVLSGGGGNVTLQAAALREGAPLVELVEPINGSIFHPAAEGFQFRASTISPNTIPTNQVRLFLNGLEVSDRLTFTGSDTSRTATLSQLEPNRFYQGQIIAADQNGQAATNRFVFDTFSSDGAVVIESEDYNYSEDGVTGGLFRDNAPPNAYLDFFGVAEVDYHTTGQGTGPYRSADAIATDESTDQLRAPWVTAGVPDYDVIDLQAGDWLNYTRTFPEGNYFVYLRYASLEDQVLQLDQVTGNAGQPSQTLELLGTINALRTGNENSYRYAPMTDALGNPIPITLSGRQTLRLTGTTVEPGFGGLQANFLLLAPTTGPATRAPSIDFASPGPDAEEVPPDAGLRITMLNGDTAVVPGSIQLRLDGNDVTGTATIASTATGASIAYQPPGMFPLNSTHTIALVFADNATPPAVRTNQWSFTVANLPVLSPAWATAPGSGRTNGFLIRMAKAPNDSEGSVFTNSAARAELQLRGQLIDPLSGEPFLNEATGPGGDGNFTEPEGINYQQDGLEEGYFPGDTTFPGVDAGDPDYMAMEATFHLDLAAGIHRLGVRSDDGFALSAGPATTNATVNLGRYEGSRGSGLPDGSTEFEFVVEQGGVYPFRLIWYEGTGGADLELFSVNRSTLGGTNVVRTLVNDPSAAGSLKAFVSREGTPTPIPEAPVIQSAQISGGNVRFSFATQAGATYTVQTKERLTDPTWQNVAPTVAGDGTVRSVEFPASGASAFYRLMRN
jgi:hypothetical protein